MTNETKESLRERLEKNFWKLRIPKYTQQFSDVLAFIESELDQALKSQREEIEKRIKKISFIDLYLNYKDDKRFTVIDEILDIGIKEDIISLIQNK